MFETAMEHIIAVEGSRYTDHPSDRGGPTKYGITLITLERYRRKPQKPIDVRNLTRRDATKIYYDLYWVPLRLNEIKDDMEALVIFDFGVHCGNRVAIKLAQKSLNLADPWLKLAEDGIVGPQTIKALNSVEPKQFGFYFFKGVQSRYITIVKRDPTQLVFLHGWMNRSYLILEKFL